MSSTILTIAACHALFPIIGCIAKGKIGLWLGAAVGAGIAILLGGGRYGVIDLIGVAIGIAIALIFSTEDKKEKKDE